MHDVVLDIEPVVTTNRPRRGLDRIRRSGQRPHRLDGPRSFGSDRDKRPGRNELHEREEKWFANVLGIVDFGGIPVQGAQLHCHYPQPFAFDSGDNVTNQTAADAVRLDQYEGTFGQRLTSRILRAPSQTRHRLRAPASRLAAFSPTACPHGTSSGCGPATGAQMARSPIEAGLPKRLLD